jgi:hypothetical protein
MEPALFSLLSWRSLRERWGPGPSLCNVKRRPPRMAGHIRTLRQGRREWSFASRGPGPSPHSGKRGVQRHLCVFQRRLCMFQRRLCMFQRHLYVFQRHLCVSQGSPYVSQGSPRKSQGSPRKAQGSPCGSYLPRRGMVVGGWRRGGGSLPLFRGPPTGMGCVPFTKPEKARRRSAAL